MTKKSSQNGKDTPKIPDFIKKGQNFWKLAYSLSSLMDPNERKQNNKQPPLDSNSYTGAV